MSHSRPSVPGSVIGNIDAVLGLEERAARDRPAAARVSHRIGSFVGSIPFAAIHLAVFVTWMAVNSGRWPGLAFDPYPFTLLGTTVSCEAVLLTTFVLIKQNRQDELAERRAHLDLQVNLLAEREVTRILQLVQAISEKLGTDGVDDDELNELSQDIGIEELAKGLLAKRSGGHPR